jgi:hypothetical protein
VNDELIARVLRPLLQGGEVRPLRPIGTRRALRLAETAEGSLPLEPDVASARLREARRLWPVDALPELSVGEWLLLAALNDLLQVNNPDLMWRRKRPARLLALTAETIRAAGPARSAAEALARHATLSRVVELERRDTHVSWWVGERWFIGATPPRRLLAWPALRRVHTRTQRARFHEMAGESPWAATYRETVAAWFSATPLTELVSGGLGPAGLSLALHPVGRALAGRALERSGRLEQRLRGAHKAMTSASPEVRAGLVELVRELEQRVARAG